eukprot:jgi/Tetstr1/432668/TSEL_022036.t1
MPAFTPPNSAPVQAWRWVVCRASYEGGAGEGVEDGGGERVTVTCRGVNIQATRGELLRSALLRAGVSPHNGNSKLINCRGLGTCGTCAVRIEGDVSPPQVSTRETMRLSFPPHRPPANKVLRLACQVRLAGDVTVTKMDGFWGAATTRSQASPPASFTALLASWSTSWILRGRGSNAPTK